MATQRNFQQLLAEYRRTLLEDIVPFWMNYSLDNKFGGIFNCIGENGEITATDKYLWSQGRALWTFSALYNRIDKREEWLAVATSIYEFLVAKGRTNEGDWAYALTQEGDIRTGPQSIYVNAFVTSGLVEYARATGDTRVADIALENYERVKPLLGDHSLLQTAPHRIPEGYEHHGPKMIFARVFYELGEFLQNKEILTEALNLANTVMDEHLHDECGLLHEFVTVDKRIVDTDIGMTVLPGHATESMWFMLHIFAYWRARERLDQAIQAIKTHLEFGWDADYGGILLARNIKGGQPAWWNPEAKVWWVFTESMYALLLAYEMSGKEWCVDWYWKVHDYAFNHFPNRGLEWSQNLDRKGNPISAVTALKVKDFFHLPRALILGIESLGRIL